MEATMKRIMWLCLFGMILASLPLYGRGDVSNLNEMNRKLQNLKNLEQVNILRQQQIVRLFSVAPELKSQKGQKVESMGGNTPVASETDQTKVAPVPAEQPAKPSTTTIPVESV